MYRFSLQFAALLVLAASAGAQREFPFAAGTDSTGWAEAESNAAGRAMIESPEFPRGLWVEMTDEAGKGLAGLQVEYHGRSDSLVALRCVDPSGLRQETLMLSRAGGDLVQMRIKPGEAVDLPEGVAPIDLRIEPAAEGLLKPEEVPRLFGREALTLYLQERWQGRTGRVAVRIDGSTTVAVDLAHPELVEALVDNLQDQAKVSLGEVRASAVQVAFLNARAFTSDFAFLKGVIQLSPSFILVEGSELEKWVLGSSGRLEGPVTLAEADSLDRLFLPVSQTVDVSPLAALTNLKELYLGFNEIVDVSPLAALTNLEFLELESNKVVDVSPLAALTNLKELYLDSNEIVDVSPLAALTNLKLLSLNFNQVADVSPLATLTNLKSLFIFENQVEDAGPLAALTNLEVLFLSGNSIADAAPLSHLTNLKFLLLQKTGIMDVSPLAALTSLYFLNLSDNQISDVSPLSGLTNLKTLLLQETGIVDIGPLVANIGLGEGDTVVLHGNPLSDKALNEQIPALLKRGVQVDY